MSAEVTAVARPERKNVTVEEAIAVVRDTARQTHRSRGTKSIQLCCAFGRVLAEDIIAFRPQPPFAASAMDGYAVADGLYTENSVLTIIAESAAGSAFKGQVGPDQAVRIFTGAPVPEGAARVIIQENTVREGDSVRLLPDALTAKTTHIRPTGQDFGAGDVLLKAGERLDAWRLSLAAAAGRDRLSVAKMPRIAILCNGDELVPPGNIPSTDQIYESGSVALAALCREWGAKAQFLGIAGDSEAAILSAIDGVKADLIVTVGGASVGDYDRVRPALRQRGLQLDFTTVNLRPGKPTSFGGLENGPHVLGVPGNPASAFVVAQLFLKAYIEAALGLPEAEMETAVLSAPVPAAGPRESWLRGHVETDADGVRRVHAFSDQDSSLITVFARANCLIRLPKDNPPQPESTLVQIRPLPRL